MYNNIPDQPQQWSVHAEFTITHPGVGNPPARTNTIHDDKGVRMLYSWSANDSTRGWSTSSQTNRSETGSDKQYVFQKGNLFFTSTPPTTKSSHPVVDSGYGSDLLSPQPKTDLNRKCRSTCNIILSKNCDITTPNRSPCGRTQSLRCQTPSACCDRRGESLYGCGDPWCHHPHYTDEFTARRVSPVREEDFDGRCKTSLGTAKKDVSVQTFEMVNKCTSPMLKMADRNAASSSGARLRRGRTISRGDSLTKSTGVEGKSLSSDKKGSGSDTKSGDSSKKPRTIHIDVYCTGTEIESDSSGSSSSSSLSKSASTPQTVFESEKVCVKHRKAEGKSVPRRLVKSEDTSLEREDSDGDSTAYPSKMSSYSHIGQSLTSMSSFPSSSLASFPNSTSTCTVPDYDSSSVANTSWKDTFSDIDSLLHSRNSIAGNDSVYFVPRRIVEETASGSDSQITDLKNLNPSDSFEYANSEDKLRIKRMERMWQNRKQSKRCLDAKDQLALKLQEAVNKRLGQLNVSKDSDSDSSDDSGKWTFLKGKEEPKAEPAAQTPVSASPQAQRVSAKEDATFLGSLSDSGSSPCKSPSSVVFRQRLSLDPTLRSPFTILPGKYTESRFIAKKFGPVIDVYRKPGHHVGPAKNPDCLCDHCRRYFENSARGRSRTSSLGDAPKNNWKGVARYSDF